MFSRRTPRTRSQIIREAIWPSMGFTRLVLYYRHKMGRLKETPYAVASGFASGVAIAFTPFLGFHMAIAGVLTWMLGGSLIAMVLGSVVAGNFWTYPFIFVAIYKLGKFMLGETPRLNKVPLQFSWEKLLHKPMEVLVPMTLGSLPLAILAWIVTFYVVRRIMTGYGEARRKKLRKMS